MLKSMTAYSRASERTQAVQFVVEIQTVNRKHLEITVTLPKELAFFDSDVRNWIAQRIARGQVSVKISVAFESESPVEVKPNLPLIRQYKKAWDQIISELSIRPADEAFFSLIGSESGIFLTEDCIKDKEDYRQSLKICVDKALESLIGMKKTEGAALQRDISIRLQNLKSSMSFIAEKAPTAVQRFRQKLVERLKEVLSSDLGSLNEDERILKEIAVYSEKIDIAEEVTRFRSHLDQFDQLVHSSQESVGKTLDFLIQELHREINTISSKSSDLDVSRFVIDIKSELERIREQIQNIE
jgi:uncharacterized protein (TIGR00255 family)